MRWRWQPVSSVRICSSSCAPSASPRVPLSWLGKLLAQLLHVVFEAAGLGTMDVAKNNFPDSVRNPVLPDGWCADANRVRKIQG